MPQTGINVNLLKADVAKRYNRVQMENCNSTSASPVEGRFTRKTGVRVVAPAVIVLLAVFLRVYDLSQNPNGLQVDEASISFVAYLVAETGMDERGERMPLYPRSTWNPKHPVYFYPALLSVRTLGLNEISARLPSVVFGVAAVAAVYFLALELFSSGAAALVAAFLLAVSPWHVHLSRWGIECPALPTVFTLSVLFLLKGIKGRSVYLLPGSVFAGLTFYTYPVALVFVPLFLLCALLIFRRDIAGKAGWAAVAGLIILSAYLPMFAGFFRTTDLDTYFSDSSIFGDRFQNDSREYFEGGEGGIAELLARSPHLRSAVAFVWNYAGYFSPGFLFLKGDNLTVRHGSGRFGVMHYFCIPFFIIGFLMLFVRPGPCGRLLLCWLLLFPVGASLMDWPYHHALRSAVALPCLQIVTALGAVGFIEWLVAKKRKVAIVTLAVVSVVVAANLFVYFRYYFVEYPVVSAESFNYGMREAFEIMEKENYGARIVTDRIPYIYSYLFFYVPPDRESVVRDPETGFLDVKATARNIGYEICDVRVCMETSSHPAIVVARPAQLPKGVYARRAGPGRYSLKDYRYIKYMNNEPMLLLSVVDDVEDGK